MRDVTRYLDGIGRRMDRIFGEMDTLFAEAFDGVALPAGLTPYQVTKTKDGVTIIVGVPGCTIKDVQVTLADGIISVQAENPLARIAAHQGDVSLRKTYQFRVGHKVNVVDIDAKVANGLLTIEVKGQAQQAAPSGAVKVTG